MRANSSQCASGKHIEIQLGSKFLRSGGDVPDVAMMQPADSGQRLQFCSVRFWLDRSFVGCVLVETKMRPVFVKVRDVLAGDSPDVRFVQRDYVIEAFPAGAA